mgnify:CR=1 FL=1
MNRDELNKLLNDVEKENLFLEFENIDDVASVHFVKNNFLFMLNGVALFSCKKPTFLNKLMFQIDRKNLSLVEE